MCGSVSLSLRSEALPQVAFEPWGTWLWSSCGATSLASGRGSRSRRTGSLTRLHRPSGADRIGGVGRAVTAAMLPVRALHLDHAHALAGEVTGEARTPRPGALDANDDEVTEGAHPTQQPPVAGGVGRELGRAEHDTDRVEHGGDVGGLCGYRLRP
jgi:hypothetical protein